MRKRAGVPGQALGWTQLLDRESGVYAPAPYGACHTGVLKVEAPFPVEIDLSRLLDL